MSTDLTVTSYALLAELALQPWSAYELTKQMRGNVPVHVVARGEPPLRRGQAARRPRPRHGRAELHRPAPPHGLRDHVGGTLGARRVARERAGRRLLPGVRGSPSRLLRLAGRPRGAAPRRRGVAADGAAMRAVVDGLAREYREGRSPFQREVHVRALTFDFLYSLATHLDAWGQRTAAEVAPWEDVSPRGREERALEIIASVIERADRAPRRHPRPGARRGR